VKSVVNGVAVSRDGSTLLASDRDGGSHSVSEYSIADGVRRHVVGGPDAGSGPLQFNGPRQVWIADDGFVFVAERFNNRVQVLTPGLSNHAGFVGVGNLSGPVGVCANADIVVVTEVAAHRLTVMKRSDGTVVRRMGSKGSGDGQLSTPQGLCFMSGDRHIAVADNKNDRVSVFGVDGTFVRHVGVGVLKTPIGVACSAFDDLVVADNANRRVRLSVAPASCCRRLATAASPVWRSMVAPSTLRTLLARSVCCSRSCIDLCATHSSVRQ
jgi:DNA-binding beta-propeller fold protein YncE